MNPDVLVKVAFVVIGFGLVLLVAGLLFSAKGKGESRFAVVGLVGFLPVGLADDRRLLYAGLALMAALLILDFALWWRLR